MVETEGAEPPAFWTAVVTTGEEKAKENTFYFPDELKLQVVARIPHSLQGQNTLYNVCLIDHEWYSCAIGLLYERPILTGKNFDSFSRTICPSVNLHVRKSELAPLVKWLDMSQLVHHSSRSLTARLIGRTKANLEVFRAPAASFAINSLAALARCPNLQILDLTNVNGSALFADIVKLLGHIPQLKTFLFPRMAFTDMDLINADLELQWPKSLENLTLAGGIPLATLSQISMHSLWPERLRNLHISHCQHLSGFILIRLLNSLPPHVTTIRVGYLSRLSGKSLDGLLSWAPYVRDLTIDIEYMTAQFFAPRITDPPFYLQLLDHPLQSLTVDTHSSRTLEQGVEGFVPLTVAVALREQRVPHLARFTVSTRLLRADPRFQPDDEDIDPAVCMVHEALPSAPSIPAAGGGTYGSDLLTECLENVEERDREERAGIFEGVEESQLDEVEVGYYL